jgi:hypothetical protein
MFICSVSVSLILSYPCISWQVLPGIEYYGSSFKVKVFMPMVLHIRVVVAEQFLPDLPSNYDFPAISSFEKPALIGLGGPVGTLRSIVDIRVNLFFSWGALRDDGKPITAKTH